MKEIGNVEPFQGSGFGGYSNPHFIRGYSHSILSGLQKRNNSAEERTTKWFNMNNRG
jgi:hypothetical protein